MHALAWDEIKRIYSLPQVNPAAIVSFQKLKSSQTTHTKKEGNLDHYCSFFVPFDRANKQIYLGDHIKAGGWIPPGGHIEPGETPSQAAIREMQEELRVDITRDMLEAFNLSVTVVDRAHLGCMTHYDVWHLVHIPTQNFDYLQSEYHAARWFNLDTAVKQMSPHPQFATIIRKLSSKRKLDK